MFGLNNLIKKRARGEDGLCHNGGGKRREGRCQAMKHKPSNYLEPGSSCKSGVPHTVTRIALSDRTIIACQNCGKSRTEWHRPTTTSKGRGRKPEQGLIESQYYGGMTREEIVAAKIYQQEGIVRQIEGTGRSKSAQRRLRDRITEEMSRLQKPKRLYPHHSYSSKQYEAWAKERLRDMEEKQKVRKVKKKNQGKVLSHE